MVSERNDKKRRKSIAAIQHARASIGGGSGSGSGAHRRRRAHSMVPNSNSPVNRRNLQPRKSILKVPVTIIPGGPRPSGASAMTDESQGTESMDLTRRESLNPRLTLSRRVSFAEHARVRVIAQVADTTVSSTASTGTPPSSPREEDSREDEPVHPPAPHDENDYPHDEARRRGSIRSTASRRRLSVAMTDMDISAEYDFSSDDGFDSDAMQDAEDANATSQALLANQSSSSSSSSLSASAVLEEPSRHDDKNVDRSGAEYTVPLAHALKPAQTDPAYVALMQATHAGTSESSIDAEESMELAEAEDRLIRARTSLGQATGDNTVDISAASSMEQDIDLDGADETINLTRILGRPSFAALSSRTSYAATSMDISGDFTSQTFHSTPRPSLATGEPAGSPFKVDAPVIPQQNPSFPVTGTTQPPQPQRTVSPSKTPLTIPRPFVFSKPPSSPQKSTHKPPTSPTKPKPQFSAAFAPPVSKPSPKKPIPAPKSPGKRPRESENDISDATSHPAKRQAFADKSTGRPASAIKDTRAKPQPLSPSKRPPVLQSQPSNDVEPPIADAPNPEVPESSTSSRRPSSYFARRKSFIPAPSAAISKAAATPSEPPSGLPKPRKPTGRQTTGTTPSGFAVDFDKSAPAPTVPNPSSEPVVLNNDPPSEDVPMVEEGNNTTEKASTSTLEATERWRSQVESDPNEEQQTPQISIKQFFEMTDIAFMDELQAPRRSLHPGLQRDSRDQDEIPLAEFAVAVGIDLPQLTLYNRVGEDLEGWVVRSKTVNMKQAEEDATQVTPELFVEFLAADEDGRSDIIHQLKLIKTNSRLKAKSDWYEWKHRWIEQLDQTGNNAFNALTEDAESVSRLQQDIQNILPDLQQKYEEVMGQLAQEQAEVAEIEAGDQEYLSDLKLSIQEQSIEVESLRDEVKEHTSQLAWLEERLVAIEDEEKETRATIAAARRFHDIRLNSTSADVFRLNDELKAFEHLHSTTFTKIASDMFQFVYADQFRVTIPCQNHVPLKGRVDLQWEPKVRSMVKEGLPGLRHFFLKAAKCCLADQDGLTTRQIVQSLVDFWSSCSQVRRQLEFLQIKFPLELEYTLGAKDNNPPTLIVRTGMLFPKQRSKAIVTFGIPFSVFACWPRSYLDIQCSTEMLYGRVRATDVAAALSQSMRDTRPNQNPTWLLDACSFAVDVHEH